MVPILIIVGIIAFTLLGMSNPFGGGRNQIGDTWLPGDTGEKAACQPNIDPNRIIKVDVDPSVANLYGNDSNPDFDKRNDEWVLIKTAAPIPAWKLHRKNEARGGKAYSELEKMGTAINAGTPTNPDIGKNTYIGIGWCDPETGDPLIHAEAVGIEGCLDPLTQDVIFVVDRAGEIGFEDSSWLNNSGWANDPNADPPKTQDNINQYWWTFNVYYKKSLLPQGRTPTIADLPCWIQELANQCPGAGDVNGDNRVDASQHTTCELGNDEGEDVLGQANKRSNPNSNVLGATIVPTIDPRTALHKGTTLIITAPVPDGITIANDYLAATQTTTPPTGDPIIGSAYNNHFNVHIRIGNVEGTGTDHVLILDPHEPSDPKYYIYAPVGNTSQPDGASSLQLGSFVPIVPSFFYEWWTPACKPAIYLYPPEEMAIKVKVEPEGHITESIPPHGENGWSVIAKPDGQIKQNTEYSILNTEYSYLYYEAALKQVHVPKDRGWIRSRQELPAFFALTLEQLGLNEQERKDFLEYWIPKLAEGDRWFITLIDREELDRVEPIEFSTEPDNFIRVRFYFEELDANNINKYPLNTEYRILSTVKPRSGFTAVDWGGIIGNGSCGLEEKSQ